MRLVIATNLSRIRILKNKSMYQEDYAQGGARSDKLCASLLEIRFGVVVFIIAHIGSTRILSIKEVISAFKKVSCPWDMNLAYLQSCNGCLLCEVSNAESCNIKCMGVILKKYIPKKVTTINDLNHRIWNQS